MPTTSWNDLGLSAQSLATLSAAELDAVYAALGDLTPSAKRLFFTMPKGSLARLADGIPRTPLEALAAGDFESVLRTARSFAER
jgi:hypothetical protein